MLRQAKDDGWNIETYDDFEVVFVKKGPIPVPLHMTLTFFTLGFWAFVWLLCEWGGLGAKRVTLTLDKSGQVIAWKG